MQISPTLHRIFAAIEPDGRIEVTARHAEPQRIHHNDAVIQLQMGIEIAQRQRTAVFNAFGGEFDVRIHHLPAFGIKLFYR
ncbi:hypothetical protein D3C73_1488650 [compost metagenome]